MKNCDDMLSRFHLIPERNGRTDRRKDGQICYINISWRAIKSEPLWIRYFGITWYLAGCCWGIKQKATNEH